MSKRGSSGGNDSHPPIKKRRVSRNFEESSSDANQQTEIIETVDSDSVSSPGQSAPTAKDLSKKWLIPEILGGEVYYIPDFVDGETADYWLSQLAKLNTWYHPTLKVYGKEVSQSRSIAAYATDPSIVVKYSHHTVKLHRVYPPVLASIQKRVEAVTGETFNHVMLNRYKDGNEYIGKHRDTKENKMIVSLSLGAERTFVMTPAPTSSSSRPSPSRTGVVKEKAKAKRWRLGNGSLVIMKGQTQETWKHEIPKEPKVRDERISLTFRQLVSC